MTMIALYPFGNTTILGVDTRMTPLHGRHEDNVDKVYVVPNRLVVVGMGELAITDNFFGRLQNMPGSRLTPKVLCNALQDTFEAMSFIGVDAEQVRLNASATLLVCHGESGSRPQQYVLRVDRINKATCDEMAPRLVLFPPP